AGVVLRRIALVLLLIALAAVGLWYAFGSPLSSEQTESLTWTAEKSNLRITVTERGTLKSQKTVNGICEVEGYENKIIFIVEEGSTVQKGDVVVRIDSSQIDQRISEAKLKVTQAQGSVETKKQELEVQRNTNESDIAAAELELKLAELDLEKYEKGDYEVALNDLKGKIALADVELEKAREYLQNVRELVKKGFREPEQIRLAEQAVESTKFNLERDQQQLDVLVKYDHRRKLTEYEAKAKEAQRKLARANSNAEANLRKAQGALEAAEGELKLQQEELANIERQKGLCEIKAEQTGVVAYANEEWWSESRRIREGGTVYERQVVFFIPDMTLMQVETKIHESEVKRVAAGQKAVIRVDAFGEQAFTGTVKSVAQLSKSERFLGSGVKEYTAEVIFDEKASVALRPGMTAEVEILVDSLSDVLSVPVQAVAEHRRKHFVYAQTDDGFERRDVEVGPTNNRMIVIESGMDPGTIVALDARSRAAEEYADDDTVEDSQEVQQLEAMQDKEETAPSTDAASEKADETAESSDVDTSGGTSDEDEKENTAQTSTDSEKPDDSAAANTPSDKAAGSETSPSADQESSENNTDATTQESGDSQVENSNDDKSPDTTDQTETTADGAPSTDPPPPTEAP
ncbi:MAG: efflux RND transporter periplasmic adaptor subunit, partial [Planctomycetaceae bacterium]|nr:efflux RND transporter periplasmic adaptor subunit [Planctomycetaceae bacterium]